MAKLKTAEENRTFVAADRAALIARKLCIRCRTASARLTRRTCLPCGVGDAARTAAWRTRSAA